VRARWLALGLAAILLFAVGVVTGRGFENGASGAQPPVTATRPATQIDDHVAAEEAETPTTRRPGFRRTAEGAVTAATAYVAALDDPAILDPRAVRRTLNAIVSAAARDALVSAYDLGAAQLRERLGGSATPDRLILRTVPIGYRLDAFSPNAATVSIWRVGVVGSDGTIEPRQSWRTQTVSLVWEQAVWKIAAFESTPGPTPPLDVGSVTPPGELFASIPRFEEYDRAVP